MNYLVILFISLVAIFIIRFLAVQASVPIYKLYWNRQFTKPPKSGMFKLVVLGDSVAQGIGATMPRRSYAELLKSALRRKTNQIIYTVNLSVYGAQVADILNQIDKFNKLKIIPDIIILEVGANNMKSYDPKSFEREFKLVLNKLPKNLIVADIPPLSGPLVRKVISANKIIHRLCADRKTKIVPIHESIQANHSVLNLSGDFFHPGNRGHRIWFKAFWATIVDRLK